MEDKKKIGFKELNGWLKTAIVFTWIMAGITILSFIIGFIAGLSG